MLVTDVYEALVGVANFESRAVMRQKALRRCNSVRRHLEKKS